MTIAASIPSGNGTSRAFGYGCGLTMALGAAVSFAAARAGILVGLAPDDMIFARYIVAGLVMLPALIWWGLPDLAGLGWRRGIILSILGGAPFALLQTGGYAFAPLANGAVIAPSTVTIVSTIAAGILLGETLTRAHLIGAALVVSGIVLIGWQGIASATAGDAAWIGDILFFVSSLFWAGFTVLIRYWKVDAIKATAVVAVLSLCFFAPCYLVYRGPQHLALLPLGALVFQGVVQGLVQAVLTIMAYNRSIAILGVSRAVLFPALVPALSILIGIPAVGEMPTALQIAGLATVSAGMLLAVGILRPRRAAP
ncbi:MAG TPA: DMT family transporter [Bradyrhizobium sp.]|nr:DMT family transporter [Bradyrhizobium sp.]